MLTRAACAIGACACACTSPVAFLSTEGLSAAIVWDDDGAVVRGEAFALDGAGPIAREIAPELALYVYGYTAPLETMGLAPGPLTLVPIGDPIPEPAQRHQLVDGAWSPLGATPPVLLDQRLPTRAVCAAFEWHLYEVPEVAQDQPTITLPLDGERVFLGTLAGHFYVATSTSLRAVSLSTTTPTLLGARVGDELWLAGIDGRVMRGHPDRGFVDVPPLPFTLAYGTAMVGSSGDAAPEVFVVGPHLEVARFEVGRSDGSGWQLVRGATGEVADRSRITAGWRGPGQLVLTGRRYDAIEELSADGTSTFAPVELPLRSSADTLWTVRNLDDVGLVAGSRNNVLWLRDERRWNRLDLPPANPRPDVMLSLGGGHFVTGGESSVFVAWRPDRTSCEPTFPPTGATVRALARTDDGFIGWISASERPLAVISARQVR